MSFIATGVFIILAVTLFVTAEGHGSIYGVFGGFCLAIAVGAFVSGVAFFNQNIGETHERERIQCEEDGGKVLSFERTKVCFTEDSRVIRELNSAT